MHSSKKAFLVELCHQSFVRRWCWKQSHVCPATLDLTECWTSIGLVYIPQLWGVVGSRLTGCNSLLHGFGGACLCAIACIWFMLLLHLCDGILSATLLPGDKQNSYSLPVLHVVGLCLQSLVVCLLSILLYGGFWLVTVGILLPLMNVLCGIQG